MQKIQEIIAMREHDRFEAYRRFEYERQLTDEVTDMSERLAAPMHNSFAYEMRSDGELWFQGEPLGKIFDSGIQVAEELTQQNPQFTTELIRRRLERQEYDAMRTLALGSEDDPDTLVVLSPIPDAVLSGVSLNAYDLDRKKTLVRIFQRTNTGIDATSISLDQSDRAGLDRIAGAFGQTIDETAGSEDILAMRLIGYRADFETDISRHVRKLYDRELQKKYGGEWYAGRTSSPVLDAKAFIEIQTDLIEQHMAELAKLQGIGAGAELKARQEAARYNLAAALTRRLRGDADAGSLADAGGEARANGERYDNDCPTGMNASAAQSMAELGIGLQEWKYDTCRVCLDNGYVGPCLVCRGCEDADNRGQDLNAIHKRALRRKEQATSTIHEPKKQLAFERSMPQKKAGTIKQQFGENAVLYKEIVLGGERQYVIDKPSGDIIAQLN